MQHVSLWCFYLNISVYTNMISLIRTISNGCNNVVPVYAFEFKYPSTEASSFQTKCIKCLFFSVEKYIVPGNSSK